MLDGGSISKRGRKVGKVKRRQGQSVDTSKVKKNRNKYLESVRLLMKYESGAPEIRKVR